MARFIPIRRTLTIPGHRVTHVHPVGEEDRVYQVRYTGMFDTNAFASYLGVKSMIYSSDQILDKLEDEPALYVSSDIHYYFPMSIALREDIAWKVTPSPHAEKSLPHMPGQIRPHVWIEEDNLVDTLLLET